MSHFRLLLALLLCELLLLELEKDLFGQKSK
jgi:hypothetical protein